MWFMFVVPFAIFFVIFLAVAFSFFGTHKKVKDITKEVTTTISAFPETFEPIDIFVPVKPVEPKEEDRFCEYCGSKIKSGENKCDACGAKVKSKK